MLPKRSRKAVLGCSLELRSAVDEEQGRDVVLIGPAETVVGPQDHQGGGVGVGDGAGFVDHAGRGEGVFHGPAGAGIDRVGVTGAVAFPMVPVVARRCQGSVGELPGPVAGRAAVSRSTSLHRKCRIAPGDARWRCATDHRCCCDRRCALRRRSRPGGSSSRHWSDPRRPGPRPILWRWLRDRARYGPQA